MENRRFCGKKAREKHHKNKPEIGKKGDRRDAYFWKKEEQRRQ